MRPICKLKRAARSRPHLRQRRRSTPVLVGCILDTGKAGTDCDGRPEHLTVRCRKDCLTEARDQLERDRKARTLGQTC